MSHMTFKNDIQAIRKKRGMSQNQLARKLNIRRDELSILENGHRLPSREMLEDLKTNLDCLISELYNLDVQKIILG